VAPSPKYVMTPRRRRGTGRRRPGRPRAGAAWPPGSRSAGRAGVRAAARPRGGRRRSAGSFSIGQPRQIIAAVSRNEGTIQSGRPEGNTLHDLRGLLALIGAKVPTRPCRCRRTMRSSRRRPEHHRAVEPLQLVGGQVRLERGGRVAVAVEDRQVLNLESRAAWAILGNCQALDSILTASDAGGATCLRAAAFCRRRTARAGWASDPLWPSPGGFFSPEAGRRLARRCSSLDGPPFQVVITWGAPDKLGVPDRGPPSLPARPSLVDEVPRGRGGG
jgi:hypothetical protein